MTNLHRERLFDLGWSKVRRGRVEGDLTISSECLIPVHIEPE
jgi:hypothetical protein